MKRKLKAKRQPNSYNNKEGERKIIRKGINVSKPDKENVKQKRK